MMEPLLLLGLGFGLLVAIIFYLMGRSGWPRLL